jgi:hypothetical protein
MMSFSQLPALNKITKINPGLAKEELNISNKKDVKSFHIDRV